MQLKTKQFDSVYCEVFYCSVVTQVFGTFLGFNKGRIKQEKYFPEAKTWIFEKSGVCCVRPKEVRHCITENFEGKILFMGCF